jgi:hypothetical protein
MTVDRDRAQTTLDFTVGITVFLGVVIFSFAFIPTMFAPFETDTGSEFVVADRAADRLAGDALVEAPRDPGVLNDTCTTGFFDGSTPDGCRYDETADDLSAALGVSDTTSVNVTVRNGSGIRTLDGTRLAAGPTPTASSDAIVATRVVLLSDEQHRLLVRVW